MRFLYCSLFFLIISAAYAVEQIPTVLVAKSKPEKVPHLNVANSIHIIGSSEIQKTGATNVTQVLATVPGLQLQDLYGDGTRVSISARGFGDNASTNTLILWDGIPILNPDIAAPNYDLFNLQDISQIEISASSASVLYGDQAVGGVINITSKLPEKNLHRFIVTLGSYATQIYHASLSDVFDNHFSYRINATVNKSNNYRDYNHALQNNLTTFLNYADNAQKFYVAYDFNNQHLQLPGAITLAQAEQNPQQAQYTTDFNNQHDHLLRSGFQATLNDYWQWQVDASLKTMRGYGVLNMPFTDARDNFDLHQKLIGLLDIFRTTINVIAGIDFAQSKYDFNSAGYFSNAEQATEAGYSLFSIPVGSQWDVKAGARLALANSNQNSMYGQFNAINHAAVSTFELAWHVNPATQLFLRRAGSFRFPKTDENAFSLNNQSLQTQTGISYETGVQWQREDLKTSCTVYQLNLNNEIVFVPAINGPTFGFNQNLTPTRRNGIMLDSSYQIIKPWKLAANYSYVHSYFLTGIFQGNKIPMVAQHTFNIMSDVKPIEHWHWYLDVNFVGSRFAGGDFANASQPLPATVVFNTNLSYEREKFSINARINNLTNKLYFAAATFSTLNNVPTTFVYPAPGRTYLLTTTVNI